MVRVGKPPQGFLDGLRKFIEIRSTRLQVRETVGWPVLMYFKDKNPSCALITGWANLGS